MSNVPEQILESIERVYSERNTTIESIKTELDSIYSEIETCKSEYNSMVNNYNEYDVQEIVSKKSELETLEKSKDALRTIYENAVKSGVNITYETLKQYYDNLRADFNSFRSSTYNEIESHLQAVISEVDKLINYYNKVNSVGRKIHNINDSFPDTVTGHIEDYKKLRTYAERLELYH